MDEQQLRSQLHCRAAEICNLAVELVEERRPTPVDDRQATRNRVDPLRTPHPLARSKQRLVRHEARFDPSRNRAIQGLVRSPRLKLLNHDLSARTLSRELYPETSSCLSPAKLHDAARFGPSRRI